MTWLTWRQFRWPVAVSAGALVVLAAVLVVTYQHLDHVYESYLSGCRTAGGCHGAHDPAATVDRSLQAVLAGIVLVVPALIGIFWGAPLVARELETGTYRLGWTQSVTRTRWLATKVGIGAAATVILSGLLSLVATWWSSPIAAASQNQFQQAIFSLRGIVPVGYALFAFVVGIAIGVLVRRTVVAMALTIPVFVLARLAVTYWVRPHLLPPLTARHRLTTANLSLSIGTSGVSLGAHAPAVANGWVYSSQVLDTAGRAPSQGFLHRACSQLYAQVQGPLTHAGSFGARQGTIGAPAGAQSAFRTCARNVVASGRFHEVVTYQPASRYWAIQGLEFAVFVAASALVAAVCLWWVRHRMG